ncbi:MAG: nitroreductase [Burkholderiales bacterium]|nr:nitroreductase [Burkholderiales bacterium]
MEATTLPALRRLLDSRYSCRAFEPTPLDRATIQGILAAAQRTPSWCNTQPWQVTIVSGAALSKLGAALYEKAAEGAPPTPDFPFPEAYLGVYRERRKVCGVQLYRSLGIGRDDRARAREQSLENFRFFGAPHAAFITTDASLGFYGGLDCGLYVMSFLLAAEASGVATIPQAALATYADVVREHLDFGDDRQLVCGIAFGRGVHDAAVNGYRTERAGIDEAARWIG